MLGERQRGRRAAAAVRIEHLQKNTMEQTKLDAWHMQRALELAVGGQGYVEPDPMVGCVIARGAEIIGEGCHRRFGGPGRPCGAMFE